ncbi:hypothetical protein NEOLEDRAFT_226817 [Neolentinus lepideus HHB14362 ss-1]|uniref:Mid2 domain-containing protein n=1 Tax=Neolentinus lepideus HHB14362 ss-1 TaxID=1314782 RepID=A0A165TDQ8_9AGAM|nr:hypothetical protein NEOLEDRAFT_226817 [Neolentinus lepideus HHB14362 ss-1]
MLLARGSSAMMSLFTLSIIMLSLPSALTGDSTANKSKVLSVNSNVVCEAQYSWMDNHLQQSPCLVLAYLLARCNEGSWTIDPLSDNPVSHYNTPGQTGTPVDICECSWTAYNLISACTLCQGSEFAPSVHTWDNYKTNCTGYYSTTTYWPTSNFTVPNTTAIPYWAGTDPAVVLASTWSNDQFDSPTAENMAGQGHADLPESSTPKKTPVGSIVGGVIGGVVGLSVILGIGGWWVLRRRKQRAHALKEMATNGNNPTLHKHSLSDTTYVDDVIEMGPYSTAPLDLMSAVTNVTTTGGHRNIFVSRRQPSGEFSTYSDGDLATSSRPGLHSRSTSGETSSLLSSHQHTPSIDAILSSPPRTLTSQALSLLDDDDQPDSESTVTRPGRPRLNPPSYADAMARSPPQDSASGSHSRTQSDDSVPRAASPPGSDIKRDKKRLLHETEGNTSADVSADVSADASAIRSEKTPRE